MRARSWLTFFALPLLLAGCAESEADTHATTSAMAEVNAALPVVHVYKTPTCGCCKAWVAYMEQAGFRTETEDMPNVDAVKQRLGVPGHLASCHTAVIGDYVIEGHVPADAIRRLLAERPEVAGLAVPGMPMGSPGMEGPRKDPYDVIAFGTDGGEFVFASY